MPERPDDDGPFAMHETVRDALDRYFDDAQPAAPEAVLAQGLAEIGRHQARRQWGFATGLIDAIGAAPTPDVPVGMLAGGLAAIAEARAAVEHGALGARRAARRWSGVELPARLAAAASGPDRPDVITVAGEGDGLQARWERNPEGAVTVTVWSEQATYQPLVEVGWRQASGEIKRLVTPLAGAETGAYVLYEVLGPGAAAEAIELAAPAPIDPAEVAEEDVRRAFDGMPHGVVVRAWREFLAAGSAGVVAELVRPLLADYER